MTKKQILNYLELITDELTDAYHLSDKYGTIDVNDSVSSAQDLVDELTHNIENDVTISEKEEHDFNEAMNGKFDDTAGNPDDSWDDEEGRAKLMGPDRLPLNFPYHNDGEGRLKGNN